MAVAAAAALTSAFEPLLDLPRGASDMDNGERWPICTDEHARLTSAIDAYDKREGEGKP